MDKFGIEPAIDHLNVFHLGVCNQRVHGQTGQDPNLVPVQIGFRKFVFANLCRKIAQSAVRSLAGSPVFPIGWMRSDFSCGK